MEDSSRPRLAGSGFARGGRTAGALAVRLWGAGTLMTAAGCERGCAAGLEHDWLAELGAAAPSPVRPSPMPLSVIDCPDGLARCDEGAVWISKLSSLPFPCEAPASACACPWTRARECSHGCVTEAVSLVIAPALALTQLCAASQDAAAFVTALQGAQPTSGACDAATCRDGPSCDEGDRYRCAGGRVVDCVSDRAVARCLRGCFAENASIDDDAVTREAAFAILCSR